MQVGDTGPAESTRQGNLQRVGLLFLGSRDTPVGFCDGRHGYGSEACSGGSSSCRTHLFDSVMGGMDTQVKPVLEAVVLVGLTCLIL